MTRHECLHILRNPHGWSDEKKREAALFAADELDRSGYVVGLAGGECSACGFRYFEHKGHIIPCPRCTVDRLLAALHTLHESKAMNAWGHSVVRDALGHAQPTDSMGEG